MNRRMPAIVVAVVGVVFIVLGFARNLFAVGPAFEEMIDDFRPALADEVIATYRADIQGLGAVATEFETAVVPAMARQLGMTPAEFQGFVEQQFPAVATGVAALPRLSQEFGGLIDVLDAQQGNFMEADAIPTDDLPATTVPWGILFVGLLTVGVGGLMWLRMRTGAVAAMAFGLLVALVAVVLSLPGKAAAADDLNEALQPVYTQETITGAEQGLAVVGAMGQEMQAEMLPALAAQLGMTQAELEGFLGQNFPATAQALATFPEAMSRFEALVTTFDANLDNYETLRPVAFSPIIWTLVVGSLVVATMGAWGFFVREDEGLDLTATETREPVEA
ncbi:MAG: hypothetical protein R3290_10635 [Acidimicrobiia bacterium]|nr:hypothetical protein [Acidimicrobiia bacterium]